MTDQRDEFLQAEHVKLALRELQINGAGDAHIEYASQVYLDGDPRTPDELLYWGKSRSDADERVEFHRRRREADPSWRGSAKVLQRHVITTAPVDATEEPEATR